MALNDHPDHERIVATLLHLFKDEPITDVTDGIPGRNLRVGPMYLFQGDHPSGGCFLGIYHEGHGPVAGFVVEPDRKTYTIQNLNRRTVPTWLPMLESEALVRHVAKTFPPTSTAHH